MINSRNRRYRLLESWSVSFRLGAQVFGEVTFELTPETTRVFQPKGRAYGKALRLAGTWKILGRTQRPPVWLEKNWGRGSKVG